MMIKINQHYDNFFPSKNLTFLQSELYSFYNHNYYYSDELNELILEECDDDSYFEYYNVNVFGSHIYLGAYNGIGGIFEDKTGIVQLSDE